MLRAVRAEARGRFRGSTLFPEALAEAAFEDSLTPTSNITNALA